MVYTLKYLFSFFLLIPVTHTSIPLLKASYLTSKPNSNTISIPNSNAHAMQAYNKGTPILTDIQFDELKMSLRTSNSKIAVGSEPKCYVDTGVCKVSAAIVGLLLLSF
jgi:hypothetical protein